MLKMCIKCNVEKDEELLRKNRNECKECYNIRLTQWRRNKGIQPAIKNSKYDLTNQRFGKLVAKHWLKKNNNSYWRCECDCGEETEVFQNHLKRGRIKSCGCALLKYGSDNPLWTGIGEMSGQFFAAIRDGAKKRDLEFSITKEEIWELYLQQNKTCALSNLEINFGNRKNRPTASLDRVDNSKGYINTNIQWLHKDVNIMKNGHSQEKFIELCKKIGEYKCQ